MTAAVHCIISRQLVIVTPDELRGRADLQLRLGAMAQQWNRQQLEAALHRTVEPSITQPQGQRDVDQLLPELLTELRAKLERETRTSQTLARRLAWTKTSNRARKHANSVLQKALQATERKNAVQEAEMKDAQQELKHRVTAADTFEELHARIGHLDVELAARQTCMDKSGETPDKHAIISLLTQNEGNHAVDNMRSRKQQPSQVTKKDEKGDRDEEDKDEDDEPVKEKSTPSVQPKVASAQASSSSAPISSSPQEALVDANVKVIAKDSMEELELNLLPHVDVMEKLVRKAEVAAPEVPAAPEPEKAEVAAPEVPAAPESEKVEVAAPEVPAAPEPEKAEVAAPEVPGASEPEKAEVKRAEEKAAAKKVEENAAAAKNDDALQASSIWRWHRYKWQQQCRACQRWTGKDAVFCTKGCGRL